MGVGPDALGKGAIFVKLGSWNSLDDGLLIAIACREQHGWETQFEPYSASS